jgi:hypothetical protein
MTLINDKDKTVPVVVQTRAAIPPNRAFDIIVPIDVLLVFKGWGPRPFVASTTKPRHGTMLVSARNSDLRRIESYRDNDRVHRRPQLRL